MEHLKIKFNGQEKNYPQQIKTIADLLKHEEIQQQGIAIAINQVLVTKEKLLSVHLKMHDDIEIVTPFEGG